MQISVFTLFNYSHYNSHQKWKSNNAMYLEQSKKNLGILFYSDDLQNAHPHI